MNKNKIINLIKSHGIISSMMTKYQMFGVIYYLDKILNTNLEGDIVELGCNIGTTSLYIRKIMDIYNSNKEFHVYDSWEGLPEKLSEDTDMTNKYNIYFQKGSCATSKYKFINVLRI
jgi:O-methyltransferase